MQNKLIPTLVGLLIIGVIGGLAFWQNEKKEEQKLVQEVQQENHVAEQGTYSASDVARHNSKADCWSIINGGVYDLTSWIPRHPGGERAIEGLCGKDGSAAFNGQHGGGATQQAILAELKVGTLAQ
jgi:cytochrome b involved in lipid metabolism